MNFCLAVLFFLGAWPALSHHVYQHPHEHLYILYGIGVFSIYIRVIIDIIHLIRRKLSVSVSQYNTCISILEGRKTHQSYRLKEKMGENPAIEENVYVKSSSSIRSTIISLFNLYVQLR